MKKSRAIAILLCVLLLLGGATYIDLCGIDAEGSYSASDIKLGLDLAGGVSITYQVVGDEEPDQTDMDDSGQDNSFLPVVHFDFRDADKPMAESLRMNINPIAEVHITVNGRYWTGFHGHYTNSGNYTCFLETTDGSHMMVVWITTNSNVPFTLEDEGLQTILASMHYTGD